MGDQNVKDGTLDLEKELSCSICTDVFYQPLTLLDCLHTFCGSCLKEWFSWQASAATTEHPYTCPACRATVRDTRPNATVTTLLDILLRAHPEKGKSQEEREQIEHAYKIGDNIIPPVHIDQESEDSEDERLLQGARELSLRDMESPSTAPSTYPDASTRVAHVGTAHGRHRRRHDREAERGTHFNSRPEQPSAFLGQRRPLDHQSSLRSLLSTAEPDSLAMQEEIMQQIIDDGLLHGIDLNNLTPAQEESITERIAHAFRARQRQRERHRRRPDPNSSPSSAHPDSRSDSTSHRTLVHPPLSRPHLLDGNPHQSTHHHRRASSHASRISVRSASASTRSEELPIPSHLTQSASRSATDLSQRAPDPPPHRSARLSHTNRRSTDPDSRAESSRRNPSVSIARPSRRDASSSSESPGRNSPVAGPMLNRSANPLLALRSGVGPSNSSSPALTSPSAIATVGGAEPRPVTSSAVIPSPGTAIAAFPVPSVSCSQCGKPDIQYSLHYSCSQCYSGNFTLCLSCYRAGRGCLQWLGFGHAAFDRYQRSAASESYPSEHKKPHILSSRRYQPGVGSLQNGLFCEGCFAFADECYWHCDSCNDGAWGFCNDCVQKAKHCTHPLQCVGRTSATDKPSSATAEDSRGRDLYPAPLSTGRSAFHFAVNSHVPVLSSKSLPNAPNPTLYTTLTLAVHCAVCHRSIPPTNTRLHCHFCNDGNYDICTPCYHTITNSGKIRPEDGLQGWRRCLRGHRMSVVGFEDREGGPRRLVVKDFVGGWALREDGPDGPAALQVAPGSNGQWKWKEEDGTSAVQTSTTRHIAMSMMPPDGGVGLRTQAIWSRFPSEEVRDELAFPRNATINEVENINGDWYWGVYAGRKGLFPGNYVKVIYGGDGGA